MSGHISDEMEKEKIIIFAESGLLAGDLAAWLSAKFLVERVTSEARMPQALQNTASALIIVQENNPRPSEECLRVIASVVKKLRSPAAESDLAGFRILLVGIDRAMVPPFAQHRIITLPAYPGPEQILAALKKPLASAGEA